jgi:hypothetical protein
MIIYKKLSAIALTAYSVMILNAASAAGIPTVDVPLAVKAAKQLTVLNNQYSQLQDQFIKLQDMEAKIKAIKDAQSGDRGYTNIFNDKAVQAALPPKWKDVLTTIKGGATYKAARAKYPTSKNKKVNVMYDRAAEQDAATDDFFSRAALRITQTQNLTKEIGKAHDPAAKADLRNRLLAEQNNIAATQHLLTVMTTKLEQERQSAAIAETQNFICNEFEGAGC